MTVEAMDLIDRQSAIVFLNGGKEGHLVMADLRSRIAYVKVFGSEVVQVPMDRIDLVQRPDIGFVFVEQEPEEPND